MAFTPRQFDEILEDMVSHVKANTIVSDFTPGSVIRTILESAALEDDEQYFQMVQLLDLFSIITAVGKDLDRRLAEYDLFRSPATSSTVRLRFFNNNLISSQASIISLATTSSVTVLDATDFPSPPFTARLGEGTARVQDVTVTAVNTTTGVLTLSTPLVFNVVVGDRVSYVGTNSFTINVGQAVQAPPTVTENAKTFITQEPAFIFPGNLYSNEVIARSQDTGTKTNIGARKISQFSAGVPFAGAGVINFVSAAGGRDREKDQEFRTRALNQLQSLSRGTPLAIVSNALGVQDPSTGQTVTSANLIEDFTNDEVILYIDDGTGLVPDTILFSADSLASGPSSGASTVTLNDASDFPSTGQILILGTTATELISYQNVDRTSGVITLEGTLVNSHTAGDIVLFVKPVVENSEPGRRRFKLQNFPVVRDSLRLFLKQGGAWSELFEETDFILNKGTGEFQIISTSGIPSGAVLVAHLSYYTNLVATVQKVIEGDIDQAAEFPGVKAAGVFLATEAPLIKRVTVSATLSADEGFNEEDLREPVRVAIEQFISSLKIGEDVFLSDLIFVSKRISGVKDISIQVPSGNITVLENELPKPFDTDGNTLITVL